ncbi:hypothetical protein [Tolypothrix sp. VBCCA 56010]|uniref:hypothetical protein n=1 Tax=Tolypothrix sp. VBCCA 56010 TaxID=3137731 RepID=UPI003D7D866E
MYCAYCSMMVALKNIEDNHPLLIAAKEHLELAIVYAKQYHEKQSSIYWQTTKVATKKTLKQKLRTLAFDAYTAFLKATDYLNAYVDEVQTHQPIPPVPQWWDEMLISLTLADDSFHKEHKQEISSKQLSVFE